MKTQIKETLIKLRAYGIANEVPNITDKNADFLQNLIRENNCKNILEIGTANGYSTICFASELIENEGKITSIEFSTLSYNQAIDNIKEAGVEKYCNLICGQALDIIPTLPENSFDFIFIDGMKRRTVDFLSLSLPKLKKGGIIVIDDVIKFREKMIGLYEFLTEKNIKYEVIQIDEDDGIMIIRD